MRVYLSSTFEDLEAHRTAAARAIARAGHEVVQMETYVASNATPLTKVVEDVRSCEAFVGLYAWKRGSIPQPAANPTSPVITGPFQPILGESSFTEWELAAAEEDIAITKLLFVLEDGAPWPPHFIDGLARPEEHEKVVEMRRRIRSEKLVAHFRTPEDLESSVAAALAAAETTRQLRVFRVAPMQMGNEQSWVNSDLGAISEEFEQMLGGLSRATRQRTIRISLSTVWWSTRLFLLAFLCERLTRIRRILITEKAGTEERFVGLLPTDTAVTTLLGLHPQLRKFVASASARIATSTNIRSDIEDYIQDFQKSFTAAKPEWNVQLNVTAEDLSRWFGHAMLTRTLKIRDIERPTPLELAMVMNYPHDFVPIELPRSYVPDPDPSADPAEPAETPQRFQIVEQADLSSRIAQVYVNDQLGWRF